MGMRIGYARVSSSGQRLDVQLDRLADCDRIFSEKASAASAKGRPELQKALDYVRDEDVFVVTKLDRLARSVVDLAGIVQKLEGKKVDLIRTGPRNRHHDHVRQAAVQHLGRHRGI
jgi:DNA invertase Pin-like site-specific DNA recombinase